MSKSNSVQHTPEMERYLWLRDGKSRNRGYCGRAPYVVSPSRSRLYAVYELRAAALDAEIDADILDNKAHDLHVANEVVERGLLPDGASSRDLDGPYVEALYKLAQKELGWTDERAAIARETGGAA